MFDQRVHPKFNSSILKQTSYVLNSFVVFHFSLERSIMSFGVILPLWKDYLDCSRDPTRFLWEPFASDTIWAPIYFLYQLSVSSYLQPLQHIWFHIDGWSLQGRSKMCASLFVWEPQNYLISTLPDYIRCIGHILRATTVWRDWKEIVY